MTRELACAHERGTEAMAEVDPCPVTVPRHVRKRVWSRHTALRQLGYENYSAYLRSPHWQHTRQAYFASDLPQACVCGDRDVHLHHLTYERVGRERLTDLAPLCPRCHALVHVLEWRRELALNLEGLCDEDRAVAGRRFLDALVRERAKEARAQLKRRQRDVLSMSFAGRLMRARDHARGRHIDISSEIFLIRTFVSHHRSQETLTRMLRRLEERAYGWDGWANA